MSLLSKLSRFVVLNVYCEWLEIKDFCLLDSAICSSDEREHFLAIIQYESVRLEGLVNKNAFTKYLRWLGLRSIKIENLSLKRMPVADLQNDCISSFLSLKVLTIEQKISQHVDQFTQLIRVCKDLETLCLGQCELLTDVVIHEIANSCTCLTSVSFLNSNKNSTVTDASMTQLALCCPNIRHLILGAFVYLTDTAISAFALCCPDLSELSLNGISLLTDAAFQAIADNCRILTTLDMRNIPNVSNTGLAAVCKQCETLCHLCITFSRRGKHADRLITPDACEHLSNLQSLSLSGTNPSPVVFERITTAASQLRALSIVYSGSDVHSDIPYRSIATYCKNLTELSLVACRCLSNAAIVAIVTSCKNMIFLDLSRNNTLTEDIIPHIASNCPQLHTLALSNMTILRLDAEWLSLLLQSCKQLTSLDISKNSSDIRKPLLELHKVIPPNTTLRVLNIQESGYFSGDCVDVLMSYDTLAVYH